MENPCGDTFFDPEYAQEKMPKSYLPMAQVVCLLECEDKNSFGIGAKRHFARPSDRLADGSLGLDFFPK
ncbi:MAG: hypothetical protein WBC04_26335 [Candidatus Acidiferrales bacterium]